MSANLEALVAAARAGDEAARDELFRRLYPLVQETVHRRLEHDFRRRHAWMAAAFSTADIVQETFLGVLRDLASFRDEGPDSFLRWCVRQVRNRILDSLRHLEAERRDRRRDGGELEHPSALPAGEASPTRVSAGRDHLLQLFLAMRALSLVDRRLLYRRLVKEQSYAELVAPLRLGTEENARARFRRAKIQLLLLARRKNLELSGFGLDVPRDGDER